MSRSFLLAPLFFVLGYALQRFVIGPASHGDDRNMLLVTLGIAVVIENALLYAFRADTRTIDVPYAFETINFGFTFLAVPRVVGFAVVVRGGAGAVADHELHRYRPGHPRRRQGEARRRTGRHRCRARLRGDLRARHRLRRDRGLPADPDLLRQSDASATPSCWSPSPSSCLAAWARCRAR